MELQIAGIIYLIIGALIGAYFAGVAYKTDRFDLLRMSALFILIFAAWPFVLAWGGRRAVGRKNRRGGK